MMNYKGNYVSKFIFTYSSTRYVLFLYDITQQLLNFLNKNLKKSNFLFRKTSSGEIEDEVRSEIEDEEEI